MKEKNNVSRLDVKDYSANDKYSPIKLRHKLFQQVLSCFNGWDLLPANSISLRLI